jgi:uncharacterized protein (DUF952 family)
MARILHAALPADWVAARAGGSYAVSTRGRSLAEEGFIHASTPAQLPGVLAAFYTGVPEVVLLVLDLEALSAAGAPVRWEQVGDAPGPFPHIYGAVPTTVVGQGNPVVAALPLAARPGVSPSWPVPDLTAYDVASGPASTGCASAADR